ncbi:unnamed protein product [Adineta steineri]|uniref:DNA damage-inducible protein 1 n=1 Tax=Adineta steineri TaxID=433720 RepID=A0A818IWE0_9BILA|nr:unnamed protein product [Adineta steineri]CAF3531140.1 unnamed protein product [Adineta steineri]
MHISVTKYGGDTEELLTVEIASDLTIRDLKLIIASESDFGIEANQMHLYHDGKLLNDEGQTLEQTNLRDYDLVTCQRILSNDDLNPRGAVGGSRPMLDPRIPQQLFNELRSNPSALQRLRQSDPQLAEAVQRNDMRAFMQVLVSRMTSQRGQRQHPSELDLLDPNIQRRIEEHINMENMNDNMEHAYEHAPEFFGNVVMLYINCKINGHSVKAFVDSGAQMTIMSKACAERCGIMRLVDTRFHGIAKGVGTQKILGRIHLAQLEVEKQYFATSLSVLEDQSMDMLIGLDMLRRHRCVIDLEKNVLRIEDSVETSFLPESELPTHARLTGNTPDVETDNRSNPLLQSDERRRTSNRVDNQYQSTTATPSPFPEKSITEITKKGFTREQAIEELKLANGDVMKALVSLMAKSLAKPKRQN